MGAPIIALVKSFLDNSIMPFIGIPVPIRRLEDRNYGFGSVNLGIGPVLAECINSIVIAIVVFMIAKKVMGEEMGEKK